MTHQPEEECIRNEVPAPEGVTVHAVKNRDGKLLGHMIVIGSVEVIASVAPFLSKFGLDGPGIAQTIALMVFTSPVTVPVMLFLDTVGSYTLISLEDHLKGHFNQSQPAK